MITPIAIDFETFYSKKLKHTVVGTVPEQYVDSPHFDPYMVSVSDGRHSWAGHPSKFNWASLEGRVLLSHNARFDSAVLFEMTKRGMAPKVNFAAWHCTANMTSYLCNRRALKDALGFLMGVDISKEVRGSAEGKHWEDFSDDERKAMLEYARMDAVHCWNLWNKFSDRWPVWERDLSNITIEQGRRGIKINRALLNQYYTLACEVRQNIEKLIPWVAEADSEDYEEFGGKPTSTKAIADACRRDGIPCPPVKDEDEEGFVEWENTYGPTRPWIGAIGAWRSTNTLVKTFKKITQRLGPGDIMPFSLKYFGAHTGRWSGDAGLNMQNPRKIPLFVNQQGMMISQADHIRKIIRFHEEVGGWPQEVSAAIDVRHLYIPRDGCKMIVSDLSQIEPRVLAVLTRDRVMLQALESGQSVYEAHARATMGWTGGNLKKENSKMYALAKARVLALGYGCGWRKFIAMAQQYTGEDITADDPEVEIYLDEFDNPCKRPGYGMRSRQIVNDFRATNPGIVGLWRQLDNELASSVPTTPGRSGELTIVLPSGRRMTYEDVRPFSRIDKDEDGKPRAKRGYSVVIGGRRFETYGGKLTENLVQAAAREVFAWQVREMVCRDGFNVLFTVHDEAVLEVNPDVTPKDVEASMSRRPDWFKSLPVCAEAHEVPHYCK